MKPELVKVGEYAGWVEVDKETFVQVIKDKSVSEAMQDGSINPVRYYIR
ncbi:unnamed protein product [marine sediment metagenome]|uniref:Uncharacterized protein n=1 Tax=marine sediment metagenome TaxID=412755 RepID=X0SST2_9ZZZZ